MIRIAIACLGLLAVAACSGLPKAPEIADKITAACSIDAVREKLPKVCADPARYARDAVVAAQVAEAVREMAR